jgi:hypothetical protein
VSTPEGRERVGGLLKVEEGLGVLGLELGVCQVGA